jgi:energy-converting hydrogenase A subunit R
VPEGAKLFTQISRYDDVQADIVQRPKYKAGTTLKLIVPFFVAYGATDKKIADFSKQHILLMPGARDALSFAQNVMPSFIVSTSYEHYIQALCRVLGFPPKHTFSTSLKLDAQKLGETAQRRLRDLRQEICKMPLIEIPPRASSLQDLLKKDQATIERLDEIFWDEFGQLGLCESLERVDPVGGIEKAHAVETITEGLNISKDGVIFVGDSITDVECLRLVRQSGGAALSFNGNAFAVREAEIALLSPNALILAPFAQIFNQDGKTGLMDLVDSWTHRALKDAEISPKLLSKLQKEFPARLPKVCRVTAGNVRELEGESSAFRKLIRGDKIGRLG